jgi:hypothetical protein
LPPEVAARIAWGEPINGISVGILAPAKWPHEVSADPAQRCNCITTIGFYLRNVSFPVPPGLDGSARLFSSRLSLNPDGGPFGGDIGSSREEASVPVTHGLLDGKPHRLGEVSVETQGYAQYALHGCPPGTNELSLSGDVGFSFRLADPAGKAAGEPVGLRARTGEARVMVEVAWPEVQEELSEDRRGGREDED